MREALNKADVARLMRAPCVIRSGHFVLRMAPGQKQNSRITFAFSRKVGSAVKRNLFKRRLRALAQQMRATGNALDVLCFARGNLGNITAEMWREERKKIEKAFHQPFHHRPVASV